MIVTDNTDSVDFGWFKRAYWGGYHFPRHWNLFNSSALTRLGHKEGFEVTALRTIVSPVNWVYSIHNFLVDKRAPGWLVKRFTLKSPVFTRILHRCRYGAAEVRERCVVERPPHQAVVSRWRHGARP